MKLPGFATRNIGLKALALALAAILWTGVAYASNPPDTRAVTVPVPQAPGQVAPYTLVRPIQDLVIRVSGTRAHLSAFNTSDLTITVDYRAITRSGAQTIPVNVVNNDSDVTLDNPPTGVPAEVDRLDSRTVDVSVDISQPPPQGYVVVSSSAVPGTVTVVGPQHQLAGVQARVSVNLANQKTDFQAEEKVTIVDARGNPLNFEHTVAGHPQGDVLVSVVVVPSLTSRASAVLPRVSGAPPTGHYLGAVVVSSPTVVLQGPQDLLNTLDSVPTQTISLAGINGSISFTVKVLPPAGVTAAPATVTVTVTVAAIPQPSPSPTPSAAPTPTTSPTPTPIPT